MTTFNIVDDRLLNRTVINNAKTLSTINPLTGTLTPHSNGQLYRNTVIGTLADDEWAVRFGTARMDLGGLPPRPHPPTASVPTSYYSTWHALSRVNTAPAEDDPDA